MHAWLRGFKRSLFAAALPLPLALTLHDGENGNRIVFLTTAPPSGIEHRCEKWKIDEQEEQGTIQVHVTGLAKTNGFACTTAMNPVPIETAMVFLAKPGAYALEVSRAWPGSTDKTPDLYRLEVSDTTITFEAKDAHGLTQAVNAGKYLRVPDDWLFVEVSFMDQNSKNQLASARDEILKAVTALGARRFDPPAGTYLFGDETLILPEKRLHDGENRPIEEPYTFHYTGDFKPLVALMKKYSKYTRATPGKPYMGVWARNRKQVTSTPMFAN